MLLPIGQSILGKIFFSVLVYFLVVIFFLLLWECEDVEEFYSDDEKPGSLSRIFREFLTSVASLSML